MDGPRLSWTEYYAIEGRSTKRMGHVTTLRNAVNALIEANKRMASTIVRLESPGKMEYTGMDAHALGLKALDITKDY